VLGRVNACSRVWEEGYKLQTPARAHWKVTLPRPPEDKEPGQVGPPQEDVGAQKTAVVNLDLLRPAWRQPCVCKGGDGTQGKWERQES
jgi:hypothetical protein